MKYPVDKELRLIANLKVPADIKLAAAMSKATKMFKCKTDEKVNVMEHYVGGHGGEKIKTYVIEPKTFEGELPCLVFFHGGGFVMGASGGHYNLAKEYAEKVQSALNTDEILPDWPAVRSEGESFEKFIDKGSDALIQDHRDLVEKLI